VLYFSIIVSICFFGCQKHREKTLPAIEGLEELAFLQVADFTKMPEIVSPAYAIASSGNEIFFFDFRSKQLFRSDLDEQRILPVGRSGEGPGEYTRVLGLLLNKEHLYILDARRKIICMDTAGKLVWEEEFTQNFTGLVGKNGDAFYLAEMRTTGDGQFLLGLTEWTRDKGARLLCEKPIVTGRGYALYEGKLIEGGGIFFLANPVFAMIKNALVVSASAKYEFDISDLDGNISQTRVYGAPAPELTEDMKKLDSSQGLGNYAIAKILPLERGFLAVSNYYLKGKPRIDRFSPSGDLISSHILPFEFDPPSKDVVIQGEYLFYIDADLPGFQVFRIAD
jgi:hypothetical protein